MDPEADRQPVSAYRERIVDEIVRAMGASPEGPVRRLLGPLFRLPAGRFARLMARADTAIRTAGLPGGAVALLDDLRLEPLVWGAGSVPRQGPVIVASNHPGAYDSLALMASIRRPDLKIVISDVGFTRALPAARERFIFAPGTIAGRSRALRDSIRHLAAGGALLIYPHVEVEPDPEAAPGGRQALGDWSRALEIMLRRVPAARLQLAIASGILLPRFLHCPLVRLRKEPARRQKLAEFLQVSWQMVFPDRVRPHLHLSFAAPVDPASFPVGRLMPAIVEMARSLFDAHMAAVHALAG